ncbi:hypothetical protein NDU88_006810 [Pleurodeles waltl]|uniref:Nuclease HARBI1 n=1 Tax=Pleurodeles waltl TaxID=8319 RepID=A0AAV7QQ04_PLEWA|nr:hypothetical protein NDU88_006810 [Pleurodeles waltl]
MSVTSAAVTSAAVRIITAGALHHWLLGPIGSNVNQCSIAPWSTTAYRNGVQCQRSYLTSHCPSLEVRQPPFQGSTWLNLRLRHTYQGLYSTHIQEEFLSLVSCSVYLWIHTWDFVDSVVSVVLPRHRQLGHLRRWRNPPVYRPLVDLMTMEERHLLITYRFDRATIQELCTQLEPDLMSPIRHPTGIPPQVQVLSVLHFLASGSFQTTVAMASGMSLPMFSNVLSRVLSALLKHVCQIIIACSMLHNLALRHQVPFLQEDGPDGGVVAAVEPVDSDEEDAEEEDIDNRESVIQQYFQ